MTSPAPTVAERVANARSNYARQLEELSDPLKRKVSYSVGGRSVSWTEYQRFLLDMIRDLDKYGSDGDAGATLVTAVR